MKELQCRRCGTQLAAGMGRYLMTITFVADVDFELQEYEGDIRRQMSDVLEEIARSSEAELTDQVYQKLVFVICRSCKEELAENPFRSRAEHITESMQ